MKKKVLIIIISILFAGNTLFARDIDPLFGDTIDRTANDFITASICIADPTNWRDDALGVYGHAFIRLQCPSFGLDYCFSYESESINNQLIRFLTKKLKMGMFAIPTKEYLVDYYKWNRTVREYQLNLSPKTKQKLWQIMDEKVLEGPNLTLDLKERGCSKTIAEFVEEAISPNTIQYNIEPSETGMRIPKRFIEILGAATLDGQNLISYKGNLVNGKVVSWWSTWFDLPTVIVLILFSTTIILFILHYRKKHSQKK